MQVKKNDNDKTSFSKLYDTAAKDTVIFVRPQPAQLLLASQGHLDLLDPLALQVLQDYQVSLLEKFPEMFLKFIIIDIRI